MLFVPKQDAAFIGETVSNAGKIPEDSIYIPLSANDARTVVISPTKIEIATVLQAQDGLVIMIDNQGVLIPTEDKFTLPRQKWLLARLSIETYPDRKRRIWGHPKILHND